MFSAAFTIVLAAAFVAAGPLGESAPGARAVAEIPDHLLPRYIDAAATCAGLPWQVLAAIGFIESGHAQGRAHPTTGDVSPPIDGPALDGTDGTEQIPDPSSADGWTHAQGPMQFLPTTWTTWGRLAPGRPAGASPSPHNAWDAIHSAAVYLCAGATEISDLDQAILSYNRSSAYLTAVLAKAADYGLGAGSAQVAIVDGFACPLVGPVSFTDDWGDPRSGGRTHKGTDLFAPHGAPLVAIESGVIDQATNTDEGLGGIAIWLRGDTGTRYYYAHNSTNAAQIGERVIAGQVIAYVGNTGNARDTDSHVHLQLHPGGGEPVNPYPTLLQLCVSSP